MPTPAMSAPISLESPSQFAAPLTRKHQARTAINRSSGTLATKEKNAAARIGSPEATELSGHLSRTPVIRYECFRASARTKLHQVFAEKYLLMLSFPFK